MTDIAPWEAQPGESLTAYGLFRQFLALPVEERSIANFIKATGVSHKSAYRYSSIHNWIDRAKAYENAEISTEMQVRAMGHAEFQEAVVEAETEALAAMSSVIMKEWMKLKAKQESDNDKVNSREIVSLTNATAKLFDMTRRAAQLPINYKSEFAEDLETEQEVFIIGDD